MAKYRRKVDVFAGKDSVADKLRKRRIAIESGDETGGREPTTIRGTESGAYDGVETPKEDNKDGN